MVCVCMGFLGICAVFDYRTKTIPIWLFWTFGLLAIVVRICEHTLLSRSVLVGAGIGVIVWIVSKCTGKIGEGDGLMLMVLGLCVGAVPSVQIFFWAVVLTAVFSIGLLIGKRGTLCTEIPFAPFLLVSYVVYQAVELLGR